MVDIPTTSHGTRRQVCAQQRIASAAPHYTSFQICYGIAGKLAFLVEVLTKVGEDRGGLEDVETVMRDGGHSAVRVNLKRERGFSFVM